MYNHASSDYICPICLGIQGIENKHTLILQPDIVYRDQQAAVIINSFSLGGVVGNAIIVPIAHHENLYDLPTETGRYIFELSQKVALAMKHAYNCDGITTMQCNEPAGGQHAFHYHFHVMQRNHDDDFFGRILHKEIADPKQRDRYAQKLRAALKI